MESGRLCYCCFVPLWRSSSRRCWRRRIYSRRSGDPEPNSDCWNCTQAACATGRWWSVVISAVVFMYVITWIIAGKSASELDYIRLFAFYVWLILTH